MKKWLILRRSTQILILALFLITPFTKLEIIEGNLTSSEFLDIIPMTDPLAALQIFLATGGIYKTALIGAVIVLLFYVVVGGRVFCSWVCPVNMVTDLAHSLRRRFNIQRGPKLDSNLRYWILPTILTVTAVTGVTAFEVVNPISMLHRGLFFGMGAGWIVVLAIFLFDTFAFYRGWCSHLCPLGAFYSIIGKFSLVRVSFSDRLCDGCGDCFHVCAEAQVLMPSVRDRKPVILSGNCTNCGNCIDICPPVALKFGLRFKKR